MGGVSTEKEKSSRAGARKMLVSSPPAPPESFGKSIIAWQPPQAGAEAGQGSGPWARLGKAAWGKLGFSAPAPSLLPAF